MPCHANLQSPSSSRGGRSLRLLRPPARDPRSHTQLSLHPVLFDLDAHPQPRAIPSLLRSRNRRGGGGGGGRGRGGRVAPAQHLLQPQARQADVRHAAAELACRAATCGTRSSCCSFCCCCFCFWTRRRRRRGRGRGKRRRAHLAPDPGILVPLRLRLGSISSRLGAGAPEARS